MEKYLVVGLGNIGPEYEDTRHNIGFMTVQAFAAASGAAWEDRRYGFVARTSVRGRQVILLRPSTYMNLSGNAVRYWMQQENITLDHLLIIVDDLALPFGTLRLKPGGSDAGHNGLKHIAQILGTQNYNRLRFGIGNDFPRGGQVDFVLSTIPADQAALLPQRFTVTAEIIKSFVLQGIQRTMNTFNGKDNTPDPAADQQ